ncbi:cobalamin biosynthesis protein CbiX [Brevibacillus sp. SYP-B805]|uniref:CbiX/SirB N-terminal domain-containing protein n=1 Tax=Brevibacillus sp. SYP-B805 TaxID=1578199 RepID=UPI0013E9B374|nr:cobalamin biosynthesis protein CbiX [Brevibacillus sp. SYP-B805]
MRKSGALIIGHGSSNASWVELVDEAAGALQVPVPVVTCFLEQVEGRLIADGIRELERQGVNHIIAVPLFVASGSTHIDEIGYMLGVHDRRMDDEWERIETEAEIVYCPPMDDHPLIVEILKERVRELSARPEDEVLMLVGHGADEGEYHRRWEAVLQRLAAALRREFGFKGATYGTLHPDNIGERVRAVARKNRTIVVPLFLSEGYFTKKVIPSRLQGAPSIYSGRTYLPHALITEWLEETIQHELAKAN